MNQAIGFSQDAFKAGQQNPAGYLPMLWLLAGMSVAGIVFSLLLWRAESGPGARGLETITASSSG
jgi:hypothetical protein